ncbi:MAG: ATP-binding protein [Syntrophobacteraceae bacterium]|nr:PAS domain S-box protein [Desulfobacteraceae bacterium]
MNAGTNEKKSLLREFAEPAERWFSSLPRRFTLQQKLILFTMSMVVFMGGTMGLLVRFIIFPHLVHELEGRGTAIAHRLAESARAHILTRDRVALVALIFDEKYLEQNIAYIVITDPQDRMLAHTFVGTSPGAEWKPAEPSPECNGMLSEPTSRARISETAVPVYEGLHHVGTIRVGLYRSFIEETMTELSLYHLGFVGLVIFVGLFFGLVIARAIAKPITSLTMLVERIGTGRFDAHMSVGAREKSWKILDCRTVDGRMIPESPARPAPEECGEGPGVKAPARDQIVHLSDAFNLMTRRLQASEAELRRSEERYRLLFNSDPNPVFVVALEDLRILDANDRAAEIYGFPKEKLLAMKFSDIPFGDGSSGAIAAAIRQAAAERSCRQMPRVLHRKRDGGIAWFNLYFSTSEQLGSRSVIVTTTDITETIEAETRLIQAGKMATLGEMAAGIAHELHQPLNAIKIGSEFVRTMIEQRRAIPERDLETVAVHLSQDVDRASAIISHLREFGRKSYVTWQKTDINTPIRGVFTLLGQQLKAHGIETVVELDESLPPILADSNRIEQVMVNLVTNARDAMEARRKRGLPPGPKILTVKSSGEGGHVVVTVSDTGTGIPSGIGERIFEPFFTTKEVGKGTGLGLSISYGIVRDYGGTIDFESEDGVGTTFRLSFPYASEEEPNGRNGQGQQDTGDR